MTSRSRNVLKLARKSSWRSSNRARFTRLTLHPPRRRHRSGGGRRQRLGAIAGLGEQHLDVLDATLGETALAVAEIEIPQAPKALVVAEVPELLGGGEETLAPRGQRRHVVARDVLHVNLAQIGVAGDGLRDHLQRRQ